LRRIGIQYRASSVKREVEVELVAPEIVEEGGRGRIPGSPDRALVAGHLGDLDQPPLAPVELGPVGVPGEWHAHQRAVGPVAPAVVGAGELDGVALVVAAHLHAAVSAGVQEDAQPAAPVPADDDRFLAHGRHEIVTGLPELALVADEEPGPREHPLQLLTVDLLADEDLPADDPPVHIDQGLEASRVGARHGCGYDAVPSAVRQGAGVTR
jgi:hypothetical protein